MIIMMLMPMIHMLLLILRLPMLMPTLTEISLT